ncbi:MAG: glutathione S-transferase N-terminal domain-containing protein [Spirochaetales bacterium]|nr:glutathione S-transferase N-terminal domain-containing protein [Spirochaetales bacterium]
MPVTLYTTPHCGFCVKVKEYLKQNNVAYTEYNVAEDIIKAEEMVKKSGQMSVPVTDIDGKIIIGFNRPELEKAIQK